MSDATARVAAAALYSAADDLRKTRKPPIVDFTDTVDHVTRTLQTMLNRGQVDVRNVGDLVHYLAQQVDRACKA